MTTPLTAADKRRALQVAGANLSPLPYFQHNPTLLPFVTQVLREAERRLEVPLVFRALPDGRFEIGHVGDTRVVRTTLRGAFFAWLAIDDRGRTNTVRAVDMVAPGAAAPDISARNAIRIEAANWLEARGFIELAAEVRTIQVAGGVIKYDPASGAPRIETQ